MTITNRYPGQCSVCSCEVAANVGTATKTSAGWQVRCSAHGSSGTASAPRAQSSTAGRPRRQLNNGDVYTGRNGNRKVFGCADCSRLGRMCKQCQFDDE